MGTSASNARLIVGLLLAGIAGAQSTNQLVVIPKQDDSATGEVRFREKYAGGANYVGFKAPNAITANKMWTLPDADGTSNQCLITNGAGVLSFVDCAAGASGTFPVVDTTSIVNGSGDATKAVRFEVDGLTTGTTRVLTVPNADITISGSQNAETISGVKTYSQAPIFTAGDAQYIQRSTAIGSGQLVWTVGGSSSVQGAGSWGMAASPLNGTREAFRLGIRDATSLKYPLYVVSDEVYTNASMSPLSTEVYDLGAASYRWRKLWVKDIDISGSTGFLTLATDQTFTSKKISSPASGQGLWIQGPQNGIRYYGQDGSSNYSSLYSADGDLHIFNSACCDVATINASLFRVNTQLAPGTDGAYYLGDPAKYWHTLWANNIEAAPAGTSNNYVKTRKLAWVDNGGGASYWDAMALASSVSSNWILRDPAGNNMIAAYRKVASSDVAYADVALDWRPSGTRTLGASGARWSTAYVDTLDVGTSVQSSLIPSSSVTWDLGSGAAKWQHIYGNIIHADSAILPSAVGVNLGSGISHFSSAWIDGLTTVAANISSLSVGSCSGCMGGSVTSNLFPAANLTYDLGGVSNQWLNSYISLLRISNAILPNGVGINLGSTISRFDAYLNNLSLYTGVQRAPNGLAGVTVTTPCAVISGGIVTSFSCVN